VIRELVGAIGFLTRLPVPQVHGTVSFERLSAWFPLVGLLVGAVIAAAYHGAAAVGLPLAMAVWAAIAAEMAVTGALHPDGLADTADGLGGGTVEQRLAIMKDPRLGAYGGIALCLTLGGRFILLSSMPLAAVTGALLLGHSLCRWAPTWALARYPYARATGGTGAAFVGAGLRELLIATGTVLLCGWFLGEFRGLLAVAAAVVAGGVSIAYLVRRVGGITGDLCGAATEVSLLAGLAVMAAQPW
jgi:adenosylcobinamide-GDP ribazoletransferase